MLASSTNSSTAPCVQCHAAVNSTMVEDILSDAGTAACQQTPVVPVWLLALLDYGESRAAR